MKALIYFPDREGSSQTSLICDSAVTRAKDPFFVPDDRSWTGIIMRGVRIDRLGKGVAPEFADRYYSECLSAVHPDAVDDSEGGAERWGRDGAIVIGDPAPAAGLDPRFKLLIDSLIARFSDAIILKTGDLIMVADDETRFDIENRSYNIEIPEACGCPGFRLKIR